MHSICLSKRGLLAHSHVISQLILVCVDFSLFSLPKGASPPPILHPRPELINELAPDDHEFLPLVVIPHGAAEIGNSNFFDLLSFHGDHQTSEILKSLDIPVEKSNDTATPLFCLAHPPELLVVHVGVVFGDPPHPAELGLVDHPEDAPLLVLPPHHLRVVRGAPQHLEQPVRDLGLPHAAAARFARDLGRGGRG